MKAKARIEGMIVTEGRKGLIVHDTKYDLRHELPPLAALIWQHADGKTGIARLVELVRERLLPAADEETVWSGLDDLADAGLLEERVTPPGAPVSRRDAIRNVGTGIAAGLVAALMGTGAAEAVGRRSKLSLGRRREMRVKSKLKSEKMQKAAARKVAPRVTRERTQKAALDAKKLPGTAADRVSLVRKERSTKAALKKQLSRGSNEKLNKAQLKKQLSRGSNEKVRKQTLKTQLSGIRKEESVKRRLATKRPTKAERRAKLSVEKHQKLSISHDEEAVRALTATTRSYAEKRNKVAFEKSMKKGSGLQMEKLRKSGVDVQLPSSARRARFIHEKANKTRSSSPATRVVSPRSRLEGLRRKESMTKKTRGD